MNHMTTRSGKPLLKHAHRSTTLGPRTKRLRKDTERFLVGQPISSISSTKLPTNRQVLQRLFYSKDCARGKATVENTACRETVQEVLEIWEKAQIKTQSVFRCCARLEDVFSEWRRLNKNTHRGSSEQIKKFEEDLDKLWDIGSADVIDVIRTNRLLSEEKKEEDVEFYRDQQGARLAVMTAKDNVFAEKAKAKVLRKDKELAARSTWSAPSTSRESAEGVAAETDVRHECDEGDDTQRDTSFAITERGKSSAVTVNLPRNILQSPAVTEMADRLLLSNSQVGSYLSNNL